jgi:N6-adenosine-specific RNA methylase IME4
MSETDLLQFELGKLATIEEQLALIPTGFARAICLDWPWNFKSRAASKSPQSDRSVERHYRTMTYKQILAMAATIKRIADPKGCHIFQWTTGPFLEKSFPVLHAMGARYSSMAFYYLKLQPRLGGQVELITTDPADLESIMHVNMGFTTRKNIEPCILGRIGSPKRIGKDVRELIIDPRRAHSQKPDEALARIERYCAGPYVEIFSRSTRQNWLHLGDQVGALDATKKNNIARKSKR